ncbi:MAG: UPF0280 family protein [Spirochaetes bacterium]|jgi:hypothetical protein|nr:UPF0280 family protein [Spirochaetota bacterium]
MNARYRERLYRDFEDTARWKTFRVKIETSDLYIRSGCEVAERAAAILCELRKSIRRHIKIQPSFLTSFDPVERTAEYPVVVGMMYEASERAGVGPMASVAGAIARALGESLLDETPEMIIENGGDIWMRLADPAVVCVYSGEFSFKDMIGIKITPDKTPCGICTSSGKLGHSFSFGRADAAVIIAEDAAFADALATAACNLVKSEEMAEEAVAFAMKNGADGAIVICRDRMAVQGNVELIDLKKGARE